MLLTNARNMNVDSNYFYGSYGHDWNRNVSQGEVISDTVHIFLASSRNIVLTNNRYSSSSSNPLDHVLIYQSTDLTLDTKRPTSHHNYSFGHNERFSLSAGNGYIKWDEHKGEFVHYENVGWAN